MTKLIKSKIYEGYAYDIEFLGLGSNQINIEPIIDLPPDQQNSKSTLKIGNYKYNCLQIATTAWLHPAKDH